MFSDSVKLDFASANSEVILLPDCSDEETWLIALLVSSLDDPGIRITSYNVCYTKLLRKSKCDVSILTK